MVIIPARANEFVPPSRAFVTILEVEEREVELVAWRTDPAVLIARGNDRNGIRVLASIVCKVTVEYRELK